jgi:predicted O-methyltransferase YrrM
MKRYGPSILVACAMLISVGLLTMVSYGDRAAPAKDDKTSDAFRNKFVKEFRRSGLNTTVGDAMMLRILVEGARAKRGIEVGSASGFGAINMGMAFERMGGHLYTIEISPSMAKQCRENLEKVGLSKTVTVVEGDALKTLPKLEGEFDFLFIDAQKSDYMKYLKAVEARMKPGSIIVGDNVIRSAGAMKDFLDYIQTSPNYDTVIIRASLDKRDGMSISYKIR